MEPASRSPWHPGEVALQEQAGVADRMAVVGRHVLRDHLTDQHRAFYPLLPFVALGSVDPDGAVWASLRAGKPGFLHSPDPATLSVALHRDGIDPAEIGIAKDRAIGLLGLELQTRRRNRLNGTVVNWSETGFDIRVHQSFGNCPQYIQLRQFRFVGPSQVPSAAPAEVSNTLTPKMAAMIQRADTFFVASFADLPDTGRQVDVSHRGGKPGFVHVGTDGALTIPDFSGNQFFNTLGNIVLTAKAGLAFVDFETGDVLQLTGNAVVMPAPEGVLAGAERFWRVTPRRLVLRRGMLPLRWDMALNGWSPQVLQTGAW
jgi:predicted pyridoxine 5'-phosphate oxidase superfamily flavin-nucleotide-binding protein